ncbi:MAG: SDR family NAD(P)-dependent oxidoreductase [Actinomycetota bacterium]|nr:SDR family NAD(P)-dependent oxidoreductase [Actinomycetota bacterium]MDA2970561.1 SDR family NAD(P)-dependent oxidoreductase [Actinomycetota bacterium]MDA3001639.1 SDR family NAD(P)-dependent oxidoreductase [Actinomycetota bacterium]
MSAEFGATTSTDEVLGGVDLAGRRYLVTGSSGGLGLETCRSLAAHGASVIMVARDVAKNALARASILESCPGAELVPIECDLGSLVSVRRAVGEILESTSHLNGIVANAGIMATPFGTSADGHESQFAVDHLGHFLLVRELLELLARSAPARVVIVSSAGHRMGDVDLDDVDFNHREYDPFVAYGAAKTCNVLHAVGIDERWRDRGVRAFAVHPGGIHTELGRYMTPEVISQLLSRMEGASSFEWKSIPQGAATQVWALTSPDLDGTGALYCEDCRVSPVLTEDVAGVDGPGVAARAVDPNRATRLWDLSEQLVATAD